MSVRVVVADDQPLVRSGFRMILDARDDLELVGEAANGNEALELARELDPDVILMDVRMPELDGIEATRRLVDAIRVVAAGNSLFGPTATQRLVERFADGPAESRSLDELTEREQEILRLVAAGLSNSEIAQQLYLGETTVKTHVSAILRKLRVRDRVQAVIAAYEAGLVTPRR